MRYLAITLLFGSAIASAQSYQALYQLPSSTPVGANLIQAADGNLYGSGYLLFQSTLSGSVNVIIPDNDTAPQWITQAADGNFYGPNIYAYPEIRVTPFGAISNFSNLSGATNIASGSSLVIGSDGNFYGASPNGGAFNAGYLFRLSPSGAFTLLYSFTGEQDGANPASLLVQATDGNFYGVTATGGQFGNCVEPLYRLNGCGTVFSISPNGEFKTVYTFTGGTDGAVPTFGLVQGEDGALYGITLYSGVNGTGYTVAGVLFRMTTTGTFSLIQTSTNGSFASIYAATDGNLYGVTSNLGTNNGGTLFEATNTGSYSTLYTFNIDQASGPNPVLQGSDGNFYGTTQNGPNGTSESILYRLTAASSLSPPVQLSAPSTGSLGSPLTINFTVANAFSLTGQQCYAFQPIQGYFVPLGKVSGSYSSSTHLYTGSFQVTPSRSGALNYALTCGGAYSGTATINVAAGSKAATATTLAITPNTLYPSQNATVNIKVQRVSASGIPAGNVKLYLNSTVVASVGLNSSGVAAFTTPAASLPPNGYGVFAEYTGDANDESSYSAPVTVQINSPATTQTAVAAGPNPVTRPNNCTLTAKVTNYSVSNGPVPSGSVTFSVNGQAFASATLDSGGVAQVTASSGEVSAGTYTVKATYVPTPAFSSSCATTTVTVTNSNQAKK